MSTESASSRGRLLPSLLGILLLLMGLAMLAGGIKLSTLGGSLYYLLAGIGITLTGILLLMRRRAALGLYAIVLFASTVWALWEVGLDWWQLVPRLSLWFALGVVLLLPWFRRPLLRNGPAPVGTAALSVAVVLAGGAAIGSQFTHPGEVSGDLGRDSANMTSTAPAMPDGEWQAYGRTEFGDRYSPLKQITPANVGKLQEAWRIQTGDLPTADDPVELTNENTPLKANGMLYACTAHSKVLALDPDTGKEIWRFDPQIQGPNGDDFRGWAHMTCRGVSYYDEAAYAKSENAASAVISEAGKAVAQACPRRLYLPTADARLIALNADTGKICEGFGNKGVVDLTQGIGPFTAGGYYSTSPAAITRDLVIMGGHVTDNESTNEPSGVIRAFDVRDGNDLARQLRLLDMRVRDVLKKLANDEQALVAVAERAKTSDRQIPLRQRYAEVLATWDEYVEPMIDLVNADGAFEQGVRKVETVLLKMLSEQQRLGHLVDDDMLLRTHARILEMQTSAQLTLRHARELLLPLREEARRHNAVTRGAALALAAIRRKGIDAVPQAAMPLFTRPQSTFLGSASQVEAYVYALARFEPKPARFPKAHKSQKTGDAPRAPRTVREMVDRCEESLPMPDLMTWLLEQEPDGATDELLYWFSRLSREKRFKRERLERRDYHTQEHQVSLRSFALLSARDDAAEHSASNANAS